MIPVANIARQSDRWQQVLRDAVRDSRTLLARLDLAQHPIAGTLDAAPAFRTLVPAPYLGRMRRGDPDDPLLLQVLATDAERLAPAGYVEDPLQEAAYERAPGLLRKYSGRALVIAAAACAVNCRYCFRRHFPYAQHGGAATLPDAVMDALRADTDVHEVILSGGDPLMLGDGALATLVAGLEALPHLRTLRVHTRLPVVIPARITEALLAILAGTRLRTVLVSHVNHANEIDEETAAAFERLADAGVQLLNQSVLLRRVNDDVGALHALSERLFDARVLPYYLHQLDPVQGAAHFAVDDAEALRLHAALRDRVPGYLLPRLVREVPGARSKLPV